MFVFGLHPQPFEGGAYPNGENPKEEEEEEEEETKMMMMMTRLSLVVMRYSLDRLAHLYYFYQRTKYCRIPSYPRVNSYLIEISKVDLGLEGMK
jgi:hypothetical protein